MVVALPFGAITDRLVDAPGAACRVRVMVLLGWLGLAVGYTVLGPLAHLAPTASLQQLHHVQMGPDGVHAHPCALVHQYLTSSGSADRSADWIQFAVLYAPGLLPLGP